MVARFSSELLSIFDLGKQNEMAYTAIELLEGETLR